MSKTEWYFARNDAKHVHQIVIHLSGQQYPPSVTNVVADGAFLQANWALTALCLRGSEFPAIFAKATNAVDDLRGYPAKLAFAFYHLTNGAVFQLFVELDSPGVRKKFGYAFIAEHTRWLDEKEDRELIEKLLTVPRIDLSFVAPGENGPCTGFFALRGEIPEDCYTALKTEWDELQKHHISIRNRNFKLALDQYNRENPLEESPILPKAPLLEHPQDEQAKHFYSRGMKEVQREAWGDAVGNFEKAVRLEPDSSLYHYALAIARTKSAPNNLPVEKLKAYYLEICTFFEKAVQLDRARPQLDNNSYQKIGFSCGALYRSFGRHEDALRMFQAGLSRNPDDPELLAGCAWSQFDLGQLQAAEASATRLLELDPNSDYVRKFWKQVRRDQGKEIGIDLPEDQKKEIYMLYKRGHDHLFSQEIAEVEKSGLDFNELVRAMNEAGGKAAVQMRKMLMERFRLKDYELDFILQQGDRESWPT